MSLKKLNSKMRRYTRSYQQVAVGRVLSRSMGSKGHGKSQPSTVRIHKEDFAVNK